MLGVHGGEERAVCRLPALQRPQSPRRSDAANCLFGRAGKVILSVRLLPVAVAVAMPVAMPVGFRGGGGGLACGLVLHNQAHGEPCK
jgi:hypothetical protein